MDNTPIYGCSGCDTTGGRMSCATHGQPRVVITPPVIVQPPDDPIGAFNALRAAVLAERDRCRKVAAEHPWKCAGKSCNCAQQIAYDIMNVPSL